MASTQFVQHLLALDLGLTRDQAAALFDLVDTYTQDTVAEAECDARLRDLQYLTTELVDLRQRYCQSTVGRYVANRCLDKIGVLRADVERVRHCLRLAQNPPFTRAPRKKADQEAM